MTEAPSDMEGDEVSMDRRYASLARANGSAVEVAAKSIAKLGCVEAAAGSACTNDCIA